MAGLRGRGSQQPPEVQPCWAPGAAAYLSSILKGDEVGWEWGGGASSVWLAPQIKRLYAMETDPAWANKIFKESMHKNLGLWVRDYNHPDYLDQVELVNPQPNLWLIDGYCRIDCLEIVLRKAQKGDIVVCDDSADYLDGRAPSHAKTFSQPHPYAGTPIDVERHRKQRNTLLTHHHATKDTTIWRG